MMLDLFNKEFRQPEDPVSVNIISVPAEEFYGTGLLGRRVTLMCTQSPDSKVIASRFFSMHICSELPTTNSCAFTRRLRMQLNHTPFLHCRHISHYPGHIA